MSEASGLIVSAIFGTVWFEMAANASSGSVRAAQRFLGLVFLFSLLVTTVVLLRRSGGRRERRQQEASGLPKRITWGLPTLLGVASLMIFVGAVLCNRTLGHPEWVPVWICFVVGVHFFPMAAILRIRRFNVLALVMCGVAVITVVVTGPGNAGHALWLSLPGYGSALTLWTASLVSLRDLWRGTPAYQQLP